VGPLVGPFTAGLPPPAGRFFGPLFFFGDVLLFWFLFASIGPIKEPRIKIASISGSLIELAKRE